MSNATISNQGPLTVDCEVLTDISTQSNLAEVEIINLVQELIPRYRLRAETEFVCSNEDFLQTPRIDGSDFEPLTNQQIRALLDYYASSSDRVSQMTRTYHDLGAVTRMLEDRENDLQMAVSVGRSLLENNDSLRKQVTLLEHDIDQTTEIVKQLKHDLLLKERLLRFYTDTDLELLSPESNQMDTDHYEQKIRHLEFENRELREERIQLKIDAEHFEQHEQTIVDHFAHALAHANTDIEHLQDELIKKTDENQKQHDEIISLSYELRDIYRRLNELKKENDELKLLLSITGKTRHEYETKIEDLEKNYTECLSKLQKSQNEIHLLQQCVSDNTSSSPTDDNPTRHTVFLSPIEYANFMSLENSLQSELEEVLENPPQFGVSKTCIQRKASRRRCPRVQSETDGESSSINDSAFSDTESVSSFSVSSCQFCQRSPPIPIDHSKSCSTMTERKIPTNISSRLRLVKRLEGSHLLKRWQELAEPSLTSCLQNIPGVYTRAEILQGVEEENEEDLHTPEQESEERLSFSVEKLSPETPNHSLTKTGRMNLVDLLTKQGLTARTLESSTKCSDFEKTFLTTQLPNRRSNSSSLVVQDPDETDDDDEPSTPPSSPTYGGQMQTKTLLHQVMQRLLGLSFRTFETLTTSQQSTIDDQIDDHSSTERMNRRMTITPPSSPVLDDPVAPTPNTTMRAMKNSTFLRVSSLNPYGIQSIRQAFASKSSPGELPSVVDELLRGPFPRI